MKDGQRYKTDRGGWSWSEEAKTRHRKRQKERAEKRRAASRGADAIDGLPSVAGGDADNNRGGDSGSGSGSPGDADDQNNSGRYMGDSRRSPETDKTKSDKIKKALPWIVKKVNRALNAVLVGICWVFKTKWVVYVEPITKEEAEGDSEFYEGVAEGMTPEWIKAHPWAAFWFMLGLDTVGKLGIAKRKEKQEEEKKD